MKELDKIKFNCFESRSGNTIEWSFGNTKLRSRHVLGYGDSGSGKSYGAQILLEEGSINGVNSLIIDTTEGFRLDMLEPSFKSNQKEKIHQKFVYKDKLPINPLKPHDILLDEGYVKELSNETALRVANVFSLINGFGNQQVSALYKAIKSLLIDYPFCDNNAYANPNFNMVRNYLEQQKTSYARSTLSKLEPLLDMDIFSEYDNGFDWGNVIYGDGEITIIQLSNYSPYIQRIITELILWDLFFYIQKHGNKENPFILLLDEAQSLKHGIYSPTAKFLTEGRKFGASCFIFTQFLGDQFSDDGVKRLQQASLKIYFRPCDNEIVSTAQSIDFVNFKTWIPILKRLDVGECIVCGQFESQEGTIKIRKPTICRFRELIDKCGN